MDQLHQRPIIAQRESEGPCIFCLESNVTFNKEHLPPETLVGNNAVILVNWVCSECNSKFKKEDAYFSTHYHGAVCRPIQTIVGKKGRGAEVQRKDLQVKWRSDIKGIHILLKRKLKVGELEEANPHSAPDKIGHIILEEERDVNPRRLGSSLAKMALETVAYLKPTAVLQPALHPIRHYAKGRRNELSFLPYACGESRGILGVNLAEIKFEDEPAEVMVALLHVPVIVYAVQLSDHANLLPLAVIAQAFQLFIDHDGSRIKKTSVSLKIHLMEDAGNAAEGIQKI